MRRAGANQPIGSAYNKAFGLWLDHHICAREPDKATRNHALWAAENRGPIERWRETLAANVRARMNHPTSVKRAYEKAIPARSDAAPREGETRTQKLEREIERLTGEVEAWRKKAQRDGSTNEAQLNAPVVNPPGWC
jgi:hypothetical protein